MSLRLKSLEYCPAAKSGSQDDHCIAGAIAARRESIIIRKYLDVEY